MFEKKLGKIRSGGENLEHFKEKFAEVEEKIVSILKKFLIFNRF